MYGPFLMMFLVACINAYNGEEEEDIFEEDE